MKTFEEFANNESCSTESYPPPEYLVQPHKGETGFFMVKAEFDKFRNRKKKRNNKKFSPSINWSFADEKRTSS